ncbi:DUF2628 domain-containing protein [Kaistia dalseonensis]|uniref:DUF2628 domain-containing protein n=1 Tax=Kaistia dalseonensis TaxID=410840 RepID=A0ABU0H552_9HYPH|nr:DUF2628 domain-containing protein [Kaistia dalseonensis]MCX5494855.1 DUF2628 domain-containing protein [Kaistia dalseonensis]MDQ0437436.1 hypothetical protein [Kaistia dalseonensis]
MAVYKVYAPPAPPTGGAASPEHFVFVRESFSWAAFLIPLPWMLYRRLWIVLAFYCLAAVAMALLAGSELAPVSMALGVLTPFVLGFEGNALRGWSLDRRGYTLEGVAEGRRRDDAEIRFFTRWVGGHAAAPQQPTPGPAARTLPITTLRETPTGIVGLFPTAGTQT